MVAALIAGRASSRSVRRRRRTLTLPGEREPASERRAPATRLPDQPGVYLFKDRRRDGPLRRQGDLDPQARRRPLLRHAPRGEMVGRIASIDFLVTETEAEALLAEQQFIKRHRPRFNIRLRDDKSYPYIGISLDEEFPRVYFTRERHRSARIYFGPYSSAKRVRETLDLLGRLFQYRTCEGPEPGRRSGVPCLDYYIKRCAAPCVGYVDREEYRRGIDAIVDFLSGPLPRRRARPRAQDGRGRRRGGVRARRGLPRPARGGALADGAPQRRRRVARERRPGRGRGRGRRGQRAGVPGPRRGARRAPRLLPRQRGRARRGGGDRGVPRPVLLGGAGGAAAGRRRAGARASAPRSVAEALSARRGGPVEVRVAERGYEAPAARARGAQRVAGARPGPAAPGAPPQPARRRAVGAPGRARARALPVRIEGFDISNIGGEHTVASMVVFEGGAPRKSDYRRVPGSGRRPRRRRPRRLRVDGGGARRGGSRSCSSRPTAPRTTPSATRASPRSRT